ncbi:MAG: cell division protein FtsZ [Synergistaceae bacterium]|nr:cell division protein FtsZ [Synergistaceae bacterium]MBR0169095.1 cell division protein FtsZ [Synergistaceae bacterium]MBR0278960.1 cell division protein FtsZ [Synergistaceae bacterium]
MNDNLFKLTNNNIRQNEKIVVFGVGGGGGNALNHIIESNVQGVDFVAANTDARALDMNQAPNKIILGETLTRGLGAGANPKVGADAAKESIDRIKEYITGADMLFVTAGMGGGTGTGAAPVIAEAAKDMGVLVVGVVTKPFGFEMGRRMRTAEEGIEHLKKNVDALLVVENDKLLQIENGAKMKIVDAYKKVDEVLRQAVQGVTDLITQNGFVNLDFADIKAILTNAGTAIMGMGEGEGEDRARKAAQNAMDSPLMTMPMTGATGVLLNVTTGTEITLQEMTDATDIIREKADQDAQVIWGHVFDETLGDKVRVTMIATFPEESGIPQGRVRISGRGENIQTPPTRPVTGQNVPLPQPPVQQPQPQPTVQTPPTPRRTLFTLYEQKRKQQESVGLEEARLTQPNPNERDAFMGMPRKIYDQPAIYRKNRRD